MREFRTSGSVGAPVEQSLGPPGRCVRMRPVPRLPVVTRAPSSKTVRRLTCDGALVSMLESEAGQVLNVGTQSLCASVAAREFRGEVAHHRRLLGNPIAGQIVFDLCQLCKNLDQVIRM